VEICKICLLEGPLLDFVCLSIKSKALISTIFHPLGQTRKMVFVENSISRGFYFAVFCNIWLLI